MNLLAWAWGSVTRLFRRRQPLLRWTDEEIARLNATAQTRPPQKINILRRYVPKSEARLRTALFYAHLEPWGA